jgi:hypothetical protein
MDTLIVICTVLHQILHPAPVDSMGCTGPISRELAQADMDTNARRPANTRMDWIVYELHPHKAPLSPTPKPRGELKVDGNPEMGRVIVHWDSATGGSDIWSGALPEDKAVVSIDHYAREQPVRFTNPVVYDLVKAS